MKYKFYGNSIQNKRHSNMDSLLIESKTISAQNTLLSVVCDGVGSLTQGGVAAKIVVNMLHSWYSSLLNLDMCGLKLRDEVLKINDYIIEYSQKAEIKTATTLTALLIANNKYYIVHLGDSRAYYYDKRFHCLTEDDTNDTGKLTQYIGKEEIIPQYFEDEIERAHCFLLCTDGLIKKMDLNNMTAIISFKNEKRIKSSMEKLMEQAVENGENDNITVAFIKIENI